MALIQINEDWRIDSDPNSWILQKRSVVTKTDNPENIGKVVWKNEGYYQALPDAVIGMVNRNIRVPADLNGVIDILNELTQLINERFTSLESALKPLDEPETSSTIEDDEMDFLS